MAKLQTLQQLFKRYRKPGDIVFAIVFLVFSVFLLTQIATETAWVKRTKWFAQPRLWPTIAIFGMVIFAALHFYASLVSPRIAGRWQEVGFWLRSLEFVLYFLTYVMIVPQLGYLPSTVLFALFLCLRAGFFSKRMLLAAALFGFSVAVLFRAFLQVNIPAGKIYESLPETVRVFALTYL